jgi:hypothetical protein
VKRGEGAVHIFSIFYTHHRVPNEHMMTINFDTITNNYMKLFIIYWSEKNICMNKLHLYIISYIGFRQVIRAHITCLCLYTSCILTNGFPFSLPLVYTFGVSSPGGRWEVLLFWGLAGSFSRTIQHLSITFQSIHLIKILVIDHQHMKYVAGEYPAKRRNTCPQYLSRVDGRKTLTN